MYDQRSDVWSYGITVVSTLRVENFIKCPALKAKLASQLIQFMLLSAYFVFLK